MDIQLRDPKKIMKLSKLGSFHQSKLSFLRSFLKEFKDWKYNRDLFDLDENGFGRAVYSFSKDRRVYSLVCFANKISDDVMENGILIGCHHGLRSRELRYICKTFKKYFKH